MVYLLHFSAPLGNERHQAQHYIGSAPDSRLQTRIAEHQRGAGARITQVAVERGIGLEVVRTWPGGRQEERRLKNRKAAPRLCPVCRAQHEQH